MVVDSKTSEGSKPQIIKEAGQAALQERKGIRNTPLLDISSNRQELLETALTGPETARSRLAMSLLAAEGSDCIKEAFVHGRTLKGREREAYLRNLADEMWLDRSEKEGVELVFIATFGSSDASIGAVFELGEKHTIFELLAVANSSRNEDARILAEMGIVESGQFVEAFIQTAYAYNKSAFTGSFREFLGEKEQRSWFDAGTKKTIWLVAKLVQKQMGGVWEEFESDVALLPLASRVVNSGTVGRSVEDAKEVLRAVLGSRLFARLGQHLESEKDVTLKSLRSPLENEEWGKKLARTVNEWLNVKDDLLSEQYSNMHDAWAELFIADTEDEIVHTLLPDAAREHVKATLEAKDIELLLSPLLSEDEKEEATGMNERVARMSLNLGMMDASIPGAFNNPRAFERNVRKAITVLEKKYSESELHDFIVGRAATSIMHQTTYQDNAESAEKVVAMLGEAEALCPDGDQGKTKGKIFAVRERLVSYINFHHEAESRGWNMDFYKSVRVKAFMDQRRILVADGTGTGKTIVALGSKCELDRELMEKEGRKARMLVVTTAGGRDGAWCQEKIDDYIKFFGLGRAQNVLIVEKREDLAKLDEPGTHYDLVVISHGALSQDMPDENFYMKTIMKHEFDAMVMDECHKVKNPKNNIGNSAKALISRYKEGRMLLLSATPLPNRIDDGIGMLLFALDPVKHQDAENYRYKNDPKKVQEYWIGQKWFMRSLKEIRGYSIVSEKSREIEMNDAEVDAYFELWKRCTFGGFKMAELQRLLLDEKMAAEMGVGNLSKLKELDRIINGYKDSEGKHVPGAVEQGKKVIIYTPLKSGVIPGLLERYADHGAIKMDGDDTPKVRYQRAKAFKKNPEIRVVIASRAADEAIDLSCGETPVVMVRMMPPMTPRDLIQSAGRADRFTQDAPVEIINLIAKSEKLTRKMIAFVNEGLAQFNLSPPRTFKAQTIDWDVQQLLKWKMHITEKVFRGERLTTKQLSVWMLDDLKSADLNEYAMSSVHSVMSGFSSFMKAIFMDQGLRDAGAESIEEFMKSPAGRKYADYYEEGWEGSMSQHTQELIRRTILEKTDCDDDCGKGSAVSEGTRIIDLGGGAAYASRVLRHPTIVIDLNEHFMEAGEAQCENLGIDSTFVKADMRQTGQDAGSFDIAISSYSLHHLRQNSDEREVEEALLEINRVLKKDGALYITVPWSAGSDALDRLAAGVGHYGFEVEPESGEYFPIFEDGKQGQRILMLVLRKSHDAKEIASAAEWDKFVIYKNKTRPKFAGDHERDEKPEGKVKKNSPKKAHGFKKVKSLL